MIPTAVRLSKASRRALTPKRGNKDFYKGRIIAANNRYYLLTLIQKARVKRIFQVVIAQVLQENISSVAQETTAFLMRKFECS